MLVIFGIRRKAYRLVTVFGLCRLCGTPAAQVVTRVRTFFSLFFIPVVPLGSTYRSTCTMCGRTVKITKEDAEQLVLHGQDATGEAAPAAFPASPVSSAPQVIPSPPPPMPVAPPTMPPWSPPPPPPH